MVPNQSMAFNPSRRGVLGVSTSRKKNMNIAASPAIGTHNCQYRSLTINGVDFVIDLRLIQKHHLQETNSENAPPTIGPRPQASPHTMPSIPK